MQAGAAVVVKVSPYNPQKNKHEKALHIIVKGFFAERDNSSDKFPKTEDRMRTRRYPFQQLIMFNCAGLAQAWYLLFLFWIRVCNWDQQVVEVAVAAHCRLCRTALLPSVP